MRRLIASVVLVASIVTSTLAATGAIAPASAGSLVKMHVRVNNVDVLDDVDISVVDGVCLQLIGNVGVFDSGDKNHYHCHAH